MLKTPFFIRYTTQKIMNKCLPFPIPLAKKKKSQKTIRSESMAKSLAPTH